MLALDKLKAVAPDMVVYLNGSFVTRKPSPNDLDMLILTDHLDEDQIKAFLQHAALFHIYRRRQGIIDAIADYERKMGLRSA